MGLRPSRIREGPQLVPSAACHKLWPTSGDLNLRLVVVLPSWHSGGAPTIRWCADSLSHQPVGVVSLRRKTKQDEAPKVDPYRHAAPPAVIAA